MGEVTVAAMSSLRRAEVPPPLTTVKTTPVAVIQWKKLALYWTLQMTDSTELMPILPYKAAVQIWKLITFQPKPRLSVNSLWTYAKTQMGVHLALPALIQTWYRVLLDVVVL